MRLRSKGHDCRRTRGNSAQRSRRLAGLLSRVRRPAVCDPSRVGCEQLAAFHAKQLRRRRLPRKRRAVTKPLNTAGLAVALLWSSDEHVADGEVGLGSRGLHGTGAFRSDQRRSRSVTRRAPSRAERPCGVGRTTPLPEAACLIARGGASLEMHGKQNDRAGPQQLLPSPLAFVAEKQDRLVIVARGPLSRPARSQKPRGTCSSHGSMSSGARLD